MESRAYWEQNCRKSGEQLARETGGDGGTWRRKIRAAKIAYPDLPWTTSPKQTSGKPLKGIAIFDMHHPKHDKKLWRNILDFVEEFQPDIFALGGDNMDLEVVSHWVGNKRKIVEGKRLLHDYKTFNRDVLDPLNAVLPEDARKICMLGNHEDWINQYLAEHPEMEGLIELTNHLHLDDWEVYEYGENANVGKLHIIHGAYVNQHNAFKTAQVYGRNIIYGHGHTYQAYTITAPLDVQSHMATQIPCACHLNPSYRLNQPNTWVNGFATFYVQPNGNFNLFPVIAVDGAFVAPTGKYYE